MSHPDEAPEARGTRSRACLTCGVVFERLAGRPGPLPAWCQAHRPPPEKRRPRGSPPRSLLVRAEPPPPPAHVDAFESEHGQRCERALARAEVLGELLTIAARIQDANDR